MIKNSIKKLLENNSIILALLLLSYMGISFYMANISPSKTLYINNLREQLSETEIKSLLKNVDKYAWLGYFLIILTILIRVFIVSFFLFIGTTLSGYEVKFKQLFNISIKADFIFIIPLLIKIFWIQLEINNINIKDIEYFYPLSLIQLINPREIDPLWIYPFQTINLFEVSYWFILAFGIYRITKINYNESLSLIVKSYIPALALWITLVMFFSVTFSTP
ncbi:hypothetical protein L1283_005830 [Sphingobacterium sp. HSC-15S19]